MQNDDDDNVYDITKQEYSLNTLSMNTTPQSTFPMSSTLTVHPLPPYSLPPPHSLPPYGGTDEAIPKTVETPHDELPEIISGHDNLGFDVEESASRCSTIL